MLYLCSPVKNNSSRPWKNSLSLVLLLEKSLGAPKDYDSYRALRAGTAALSTLIPPIVFSSSHLLFKIDAGRYIFAAKLVICVSTYSVDMYLSFFCNCKSSQNSNTLINWIYWPSTTVIHIGALAGIIYLLWKTFLVVTFLCNADAKFNLLKCSWRPELCFLKYFGNTVQDTNKNVNMYYITIKLQSNSFGKFFKV